MGVGRIFSKGSNSAFSRGRLLKSIFFRDATEVKFHFQQLKVRERHFSSKKRLNKNFQYSGGRKAPPCYPVAGSSSGFRCRGAKNNKGVNIFKYNFVCMLQPGIQI